jgi:hypothetical protein
MLLKVCILLIILTIILAFLIVLLQSQKTYKYGGYEKQDCNFNDFKKLLKSAKPGFRYETLVRKMFNCYVLKGKFYEITPLDQSKNKDERFKKIYKTLTLKDGKILSLDGYNPTLNIAFEYQGKGHYSDIFNDRENYENQQKNDKLKAKMLSDARIPLIIIHYKIPFKQLSDYIKCRLRDCYALRDDIEIKKYIDFIPEPKKQ